MVGDPSPHPNPNPNPDPDPDPNPNPNPNPNPTPNQVGDSLASRGSEIPLEEVTLTLTLTPYP